MHKDTTICIFGGSGFIGTSLCSRIQSKYSFKIFDKNDSVVHKSNSFICDIAYPISNSFIPENSIIINLAAEHRDDVSPLSLYREVNTGGAINICNLARQKNISHIIFTSSVAVYGFADPNTGEDGDISPFNEYGRTKFEAESIYREWYKEDPENRTLVIVRPTVVFGEGNRGNVYSLIKQIASGKFLMIGKGDNKKSMAYVENIAAFLEHTISFNHGLHLYNYCDKPDYSMNELVLFTKKILGKKQNVGISIPYTLAILISKILDLCGKILKIKFSVSEIRIRKFCSNSTYSSKVIETNFIAPFALSEAFEKTIHNEFMRHQSPNK